MTDALLKMQQEMAHVLQAVNAKLRVAGVVATVLLGNDTSLREINCIRKTKNTLEIFGICFKFVR